MYNKNRVKYRLSSNKYKFNTPFPLHKLQMVSDFKKVCRTIKKESEEKNEMA